MYYIVTAPNMTAKDDYDSDWDVAVNGHSTNEADFEEEEDYFDVRTSTKRYMQPNELFLSKSRVTNESKSPILRD